MYGSDGNWLDTRVTQVAYAIFIKLLTVCQLSKSRLVFISRNMKAILKKIVSILFQIRFKLLVFAKISEYSNETIQSFAHKYNFKFIRNHIKGMKCLDKTAFWINLMKPFRNYLPFSASWGLAGASRGKLASSRRSTRAPWCSSTRRWLSPPGRAPGWCKSAQAAQTFQQTWRRQLKKSGHNKTKQSKVSANSQF